VKLIALLFLAMLPSAVATGRETASRDRVVPPGQEEVLAQILGRDSELPGACRFDRAAADGPLVTAEYACADGSVIVELRHPDGAPPDALRTERFAIAVRSGPAPPNFIMALGAIVRAHEQRFAWARSSATPPVAGAPIAVALGAAAIVLVALAFEYFSGRRRSVLRLAAAGQYGGALPRLPTFALMAGFLLTRVPFLTRLPVYIDESVHIRWARSAGRDLAGELAVGKWLPIKIMSLFMLPVFSPLFGARLASVAMGLATLLACVFTGRELFGSTAGLLAGVLYTVIPFALLYDRLALADTYVATFGAWALFACVAMIRRQGRAWPLATGIFTYAAILSKPTGGVFLVTPLLVSLLLVPAPQRREYLARLAPTLIGGMALVTFLLWGGYGTGQIASQSPLEGVEQLERLRANLGVSAGWFITLLTPMVALSALVAAVTAVAARARAEVLLVALFVLSFLPYAWVAKVWFPSYLIFTVVPIVLLTARAITVCAALIVQFGRRFAPRARIASPGRIATILTLPFVVMGLSRDVFLMAKPQEASLPPVEQRFLRGWTSGYGLPELASFLREQARDGELNVVRFDLIGRASDGLEVYLNPSASLQLHTVRADPDLAADEIAKLATMQRTLFVSDPEREESQGITTRAYLGRAIRIWPTAISDPQSGVEVWEVFP